MRHKTGQSLVWGQILGPSWLFWIFFFFLFECSNSKWKVLSEHLQLVFHSGAQHPLEINQSEPPLLAVTANGRIKAR